MARRQKATHTISGQNADNPPRRSARLHALSKGDGDGNPSTYQEPNVLKSIPREQGRLNGSQSIQKRKKVDPISQQYSHNQQAPPDSHTDSASSRRKQSPLLTPDNSEALDDHRNRDREAPSEEQDFGKQSKITVDVPSIKSTSPAHVEPLDEKALHNPVAHWASTQIWPPGYANMSQSTGSKKRSAPSDASESSLGTPKPHSRKAEQTLAEHKLYMQASWGESLVSTESKKLCEDLLGLTYPELTHMPYPLSKYRQVWDRVQRHNERRLVRDITPILVPSAELLYICGGHDNLEHVIEEIDADWVMCKPLGSSRPKPDFAVGLAQSAFTDEEIAKLRNYTAIERPTIFSENIYFPFLLCESEEAISKAERQNMHSASIIVNSIIQLFRAADRVTGQNKVMELNGKILAFSISHDNERAKLFGHFASIKDGNVAFHRYHFEYFLLNFQQRPGRKRTCDFVQAVYEKFYPAHLGRIQEALRLMKEPEPTAAIVDMNISNSESTQPTTSVASVTGTGQFKVPGLPSNKRQEGELAALREQLAEQQAKNVELQRNFTEQLAQMQTDAREQQKQFSEQLAQMQTDAREQQKQYSEQMKFLIEQLGKQQR